MNRYVVDGMIADARNRKAVLFIGQNHAVARHAFEQTVDRARDLIQMEAVRFERSRGRERVVIANGGQVRFLSYRSQAHRGLSVDVVYLNSEWMEFDEYLPAVSATSGEVMYP